MLLPNRQGYHMKRTLKAILAADIVGYSRLMESDEAGTVARQKTLFSEIVQPAIARSNGRIVKLMGDGVLIEFGSVVEAVTCAVNLQKAVEVNQSDVSKEHRFLYRIGINLGDVFHENDDIFGDGVNIAARLEQLAEPGGICISGTVYDHLKSNIPVGYEALGDIKVKNIEQPVRVYRILLDGGMQDVVSLHKVGAPIRLWRTIAFATVLSILGFLSLWMMIRSAQKDYVQPSAVEPAPDQGSDGTTLTAAVNRQSIAVLPFDNLGDPNEQSYFSDGMTEDLITDLSQVSGLFVIARNTVFTYKGRAVNVKQVGQELRVRYVLEGSVRKSGDRFRINAQLIDTQTGGHVWAERYDRHLTDVFAIQDDVVTRIVAALSVTLNADEEIRLARTEKIDPNAYDALLRGLEKLRRFSLETNLEARAFFETAIEIDPGFARAYADLALTYALEAEQSWTNEPEAAKQKALDYGSKALELDPSVSQVHFVLSVVYRNLNRAEESVDAARLSVELEPSYADGFATLALSLNSVGQPQEALVALERATELNPLRPFFYVWAEGQAYYLMGQFERAATLFEEVARSNPQFSAAHKMLAVTYVELGRMEDAQWAAHELLVAAPGFTLDFEANASSYTEPQVKERYLDGLKAAGLN
jgi:adenylate cyclase